MAHDVKHGTLTADAVSLVTLDGNYVEIEVLNRDGAAEIYFTVNGAAPSVGGEDSYVVPATVSGLRLTAPLGEAVTEVRLISAGTPAYTVTGVR